MRCESINKASYIRTDIFAGGNSFIGVFAKVRWLLIIGFFLRRPRLHFIKGGIIGLVGLIGSRVSFKVGRGVFSPSSLSSLLLRVAIRLPFYN